jgi:hypothetical protein
VNELISTAVWQTWKSNCYWKHNLSVSRFNLVLGKPHLVYIKRQYITLKRNYNLSMKCPFVRTCQFSQARTHVLMHARTHTHTHSQSHHCTGNYFSVEWHCDCPLIRYLYCSCFTYSSACQALIGTSLSEYARILHISPFHIMLVIIKRLKI